MRIVIADDHPLLREAIRATVEHVWPERDIIEAGSAAAARAEAEEPGASALPPIWTFGRFAHDLVCGYWSKGFDLRKV
ncbi:MAG: hypothetical protein R3E18_06830 [Sphingomonadaceae bacterium]|nr:response regulator transcription factor [Sphingomonadaceae bacterium]